jgi:Protein of unknown function (DUF4238)
VNRSYLRRFADADGLLTRVQLPGDKRIPMSVTDATVVRNFYVVTLPDGTESDAAEDAFGILEAAAAEAIRSIVDHETWPIPASARQDIAGWAALQYLRGPRVRQLGREIAEEFSGAGVSVGGSGGQKIVLKMPAEGLRDLTGPVLQLQLIQRQLPAVARMLYERDWILTYYERKRLATSDTPVALLSAADHPDMLGVGIFNAGEIYVPLDRRVGLSMARTGAGDVRIPGVAKTALYSNNAIARNTRRYLFHHPADDPLSGLELPEPRARELAHPDTAGDLIQHLFT